MKPATLKWLLAASVAVNLFLASAMLGATAWWFTATGANGPPQRGLRFAADALPAPEKAAFRQRLRDTRREAQPDLQAAREGRRELARLLAAPEFDRAAVQATAERTRKADLAARSHIEAAVMDFAATLPPASRSALADGLVQHGPLRTPPTNPPASGG